LEGLILIPFRIGPVI